MSQLRGVIPLHPETATERGKDGVSMTARNGAVVMVSAMAPGCGSLRPFKDQRSEAN